MKKGLVVLILLSIACLISNIGLSSEIYQAIRFKDLKFGMEKNEVRNMLKSKGHTIDVTNSLTNKITTQYKIFGESVSTNIAFSPVTEKLCDIVLIEKPVLPEEKKEAKAAWNKYKSFLQHKYGNFTKAKNNTGKLVKCYIWENANTKNKIRLAYYTDPDMYLIIYESKEYFKLMNKEYSKMSNKIAEAEGGTRSRKERKTSKSKQKGTRNVVKRFSGSGAQSTRPFTVKGRWEIQWDAEGDFFSISLHTADGDIKGIAANQQGAGKGSSYQPHGGKYYLKINAMGNWRIKVVDIK